MGSGKSGGGAKSYDYYGTLAGAICWGTAHTLQVLLVDGFEAVTGPVTLAAAATELTLNPEAEEYLDKGGRITIYRGDQTTADAALVDHPPYAGLCYVVFVGLLFGRERSMAPNIQAIISRLPAADTSLVGALYNGFTSIHLGGPTIDSQVSPVAALVELLTGRHGLGLPVASMDATSWSEAAIWVADAARKSFAFCSPLWTSQTDARGAIASLLEMIDATLYWTTNGKLAIALLKPGFTPGSPQTIDARHITSRHILDAPGFGDVPTCTLVRFTDRAAQWKERDQKVDNLVSLGLRGGVQQVVTIDRPHITGATQAAAHAAEMSLRASRPIGEIRATVRRPVADNLHPGAKVLFDIDPEPGGDGIAQLCVVESLSVPASGPVEMILRPDTMVTSRSYSPAWTEADPQNNACPPIEELKCVVIPLPAEVWTTSSVAVLAPRPRVDVIAFSVFYSPDDIDYADLGSQPGFAVRAALVAGITAIDEQIILTLPEGTTGPDAYLAERYPTTEAGMLADELILVLVNLDVSGRVVITSGIPEMEFCSIKTRALVGADMTYTIARARQGTQPVAWTTAAKAWIIPLESIVPWTHPGIRGMITSGAAGYIHLVASTAEDIDNSSPIPERTFLMASNADPRPFIAWSTPSGSVGTTDSAGQFTPAFIVSDSQGDLTEISLHSVSQNGDRVDWGTWKVSPSKSWTYLDDQLFFDTAGTYELTVTARDITGAQSSSSVTIERIASSGGNSLPAPRFSPKSGTKFSGKYLLVTLTISSPGDRYTWQIMPPGSPPPTSPYGALGTSRVVGFTASSRIWVRSGDGTNWGGWVFADYSRV